MKIIAWVSGLFHGSKVKKSKIESKERRAIEVRERENIANDFRVTVGNGQREILNERLMLCASG